MMENINSLLHDTEIISLTEEKYDVSVFKTNLTSENDLRKIAVRFAPDSRIKRWNVDMQDIDRVLRIESQQVNAKEIINNLAEAGFSCEELTD